MALDVCRPLASLCVCLAMLSGCGSDPVREQWASRDSLADCGSLDLEQGDALEEKGTREIACLDRALDSGGDGELVVRYPTVEGDPITEYYRVLSDGTTEVYVDSTEDPNSDQTWGFASCDQPTSALDVSC